LRSGLLPCVPARDDVRSAGVEMPCERGTGPLCAERGLQWGLLRGLRAQRPEPESQVPTRLRKRIQAQVRRIDHHGSDIASGFICRSSQL
jgi:hypothetical protein